MAGDDVQTWLRSTGPRVLRRIGVKPGQVVADLGCRWGHYARAAAQIVGEGGRVYAVDRDEESLQGLRDHIGEHGVTNVVPVQADMCIDALPIPPESVDVVLLFDVLHGVFFPAREQRRALLQRVRQWIAPHGVLAVYPTHVRQHGPPLAVIEHDIQSQGFGEIGRSRPYLLHDDRRVRGWVIRYRPSPHEGGGRL